MKGLYLITGPPGVGKTTLLARLVERLRAAGLRVGGILSYEKRHAGKRVGFEILDVATGERGMLAAESHGPGPRVGRYVVNLEVLARLAAPAIRRALEGADVVVVDEVGPMELYSPEFRRAVEDSLHAQRTLILVVHEKSRDPLVRRIREAGERALVVERGKMDALLEPLVEEVRRDVEARGRHAHGGGAPI